MSKTPAPWEIALVNHCCPQCGEHHVRRSRRRFFDFPFRAFGLVAFRCKLCGMRFFRDRGPLGANSFPG